jgi:D-3-phosphoglycerate dehydrogenase
LATEKPFSSSARDKVVAIAADAGYKVTVLEGYKGKEPLLQAVADVDAVIVRSDIIDAQVLDGAPKLKLVVRAGAGYDNVDCAAAKARGVAVMNTPGQNANAVAELAFGLMVYMARGKFDGKTGSELKDKSLVVHAIGAVGKRVAAIARGFGMAVRAYDPFVSAQEMRAAGAEPAATVEDLYRSSDYVSLHIPANAQTRKSIGAGLLSLMPSGGCLINTARGEVIDEEGLLAVLEARKDLRYATDIAPSDPVQEACKAKFASRVYWTPKKMGAQTEEANVNAGLAAARQIVGFFERGERRFIVN